MPSYQGTLFKPSVYEEWERVIAKYPARRSAVLPLLWIAQREMGYVSKEAMREIGAALDLSFSEVQSITSFYILFDNISCMLRGGDKLLEYLEHKLGIRRGETTPDGLITLRFQECLAACTDAPMMQVDDHYELNVTPEKADRILAELGWKG